MDSLIGPPLLPEKSRSHYESGYMRFEKWCEESNNMDNLNEQVLLTYFKEKSQVQKPSSLWAQFYMMRSVICLKKNVDIQKYSNLLAFLKQNAVGYQSTKPKLLTKQELDTFLKEADDNTYLLMKVALIIGISGSCSRDELSYLLINDVKDEGYYFRITITSNQTRSHRDFIILDETTNGVNLVEIIRKYIRLRPLHADQPRFLLTYRNGKCTSQPVGVNKIGVFPKKAASFLGLSDPDGYTGYRSGRSARQGGTVGRKTIAVRNEYDEYI